MLYRRNAIGKWRLATLRRDKGLEDCSKARGFSISMPTKKGGKNVGINLRVPGHMPAGLTIGKNE